MRVALVNPPRQDGIPVVREERHEFRLAQTVLYPLSLMHAAALLEGGGHVVLLLDANARDLSAAEVARQVDAFAADLLLTRVAVDGVASDLAFLDAMRTRPYTVARSRVVTLAGLEADLLRRFPRVDAFPPAELEQVAKSRDTHLVGGELVGVPTFSGPAAAKSRDTHQVGGELVGVPTFVDWNAVPMPAYHLLPDLAPYGRVWRRRGRRFGMLESSRGCPYPCTFCIEARTRWRAKDADRVADEMLRLGRDFGVHHVQFQDETFTVSAPRVEEICRRVQGRGLTWECNARPDHAAPALVRAMARAGCRRIHFGVESLNDAALAAVRKGFDAACVERAVRTAFAAGMAVGASVIIGLPGDTRETILDTVRRLRRLPLAGCQFTLALPYPGTAFAEQARALGWLPGAVEWTAFDQTRPNLRRPDLPPAALAELRQRAYRMYYAHPVRVLAALSLVRSPADVDDLLGRAANLAGKLARGFRYNR